MAAARDIGGEGHGSDDARDAREETCVAAAGGGMERYKG